MNLTKFILIQKKRNFGYRYKGLLKSEDFKINEENKPRSICKSIKLEEKKSYLIKVFLLLCDYRRMTNVPLGQYNHQRCFMII